MSRRKRAWHVPYGERNRVLRAMGYSDYRAYLGGELWAAIRRRVIERCGGVCEVCGTYNVYSVHHRSYHLAALKGERIDHLTGCCHGCHEACEVGEDRAKLGLTEANGRMVALARSHGHALPGMCAACGTNGTRQDEELCGRCAKESRPATLRRVADLVRARLE